MTQEQVHLTHPGTGGTFATSREAFEALWRDKGWVQASPAEVVAAQVTDGAVSDLHRLSKVELVELAAARGLDLTGTKEDLIARLEAEVQV